MKDPLKKYRGKDLLGKYRKKAGEPHGPLRNFAVDSHEPVSSQTRLILRQEGRRGKRQLSKVGRSTRFYDSDVMTASYRNHEKPTPNYHPAAVEHARRNKFPHPAIGDATSNAVQADLAEEQGEHEAAAHLRDLAKRRGFKNKFFDLVRKNLNRGRFYM